MLHRGLIIVLSLLTTIAMAGDQPQATGAEWKLVSDDDGIEVYQKDTRDSPVVSFRGQTTLPAPPRQVFAILANNTHAHEWMPLVEGKQDVEQVAEHERVEITLIQMPWPLTDRYFVNKGKVEFFEDGRIEVSTQSVEDPQVTVPDRVLGFLHTSEFKMRPTADGRQTVMTIEVNSDPRGLIPKFLVNRAQRSWPRKFFRGLKGQIKLGRGLEALEDQGVSH